MPKNSNLGPMKITQWGECFSIWSDLKNAKTIIGGFEFDLLEFRSIVEKYSVVPTKDFFDILENYCYIPVEENPNGIDIRTAYLSGEPFKAIFDPLASASLDWDLIQVMLERNDLGSSQHTTNTESIQSQLLDQIEIRLNLFAHREEQRALFSALKEVQKDLLSTWVPFADRIDIFWKTAYKVCLGKTYDNIFQYAAFQAQPNNAVMNLFFLANKDIRLSYLNMIREYICFKQKIPQNLKILRKMMDTLFKVLQKTPTTAHLAIYENAILQACEQLQQFTHRIISMAQDARYMMLDIYLCQPFLDQLDDLPFFIDALTGHLLSSCSVEEKISITETTKSEIELALAAWSKIEQERQAAEELRFKQNARSPAEMETGEPTLSDAAFNAALATIPDHPQEISPEEAEITPTKSPRFYVSSDPDTARLLKKKDGIVRFGYAKKRADKLQMNVYDSSENYALVYSAGANQNEVVPTSSDDI